MAVATFIFALLLCIAAPSFAKLVEPTPLVLDYHNGPVLSGEAPIKVFVLFYGSFSRGDKAAITDFLSSFKPAAATPPDSVAAWWSLTAKYVDAKGAGVSQSLKLAAATSDRKYSLGKSLTRADVATLARRAASSAGGAASMDPRAVHLVLTAADVTVEGFCRSTCGEHLHAMPGAAAVPYAWVGNSATQCPGFCAWPYAKPQYGPQQEPLKAPNSAAVDGMIITIAKVLAGAATNPFGTAYYQGVDSFALEAAGACSAAYGPGAYPGNPGTLSVDAKTGASYNVRGINGREFLVPWMWNPATRSCAGHP